MFSGAFSRCPSVFAPYVCLCVPAYINEKWDQGPPLLLLLLLLFLLVSTPLSSPWMDCLDWIGKECLCGSTPSFIYSIRVHGEAEGGVVLNFGTALMLRAPLSVLFIPLSALCLSLIVCVSLLSSSWHRWWKSHQSGYDCRLSCSVRSDVGWSSSPLDIDGWPQTAFLWTSKRQHGTNIQEEFVFLCVRSRFHLVSAENQTEDIQNLIWHWKDLRPKLMTGIH